jgi:hypothetical protein
MKGKKKDRPGSCPWADNEIELALKKELTGRQPEDEYVKLCYESAKEAYLALIGQGHSGMSMSLTKFILNRLIDRKPLTAITEEDFNGIEPLDWQDWFLEKNNLSAVYQCPRYSSLFKHVKKDGSIKYSDNNRVETIDRNGATCISGRVAKIVEGLYPLELPYFPGNPYKVYTAEFTYDSEKDEVHIEPGLYNAIYISHLVTPEGKRVTLNIWYFEEELDQSKIDLVSLKDKLVKALVLNGLPTCNIDS